LICCGTLVVFITLHELVHLSVGRLLHLPTHFINPTAACLSDADAASAPGAALAWMNGAAPVFTMTVGLFALGLLRATPRRRGSLAWSLLGWIALLGVPYIGVQLMLLAAPASARGNGVDSAAVVIGYFGITNAPRIVLVIVGTLVAIASGFWLAPVLRPSDEPAVIGVTPPPLWRRALAAAFLFSATAVLALGALKMSRRPSTSSPAPFLLAFMLSAIGLALRTRWSAPRSRFVRDQWILPALIASVCLMIFGLLVPSDYSIAPVMLLPQLLVAAFAAGRLPRDRESAQ
jgi:hypothetical protein